jgi:hypothetical protein
MGGFGSLPEICRRSGLSVDVHFCATAETYQGYANSQIGNSQTPQSGVVLIDPWRLASRQGAYEAAQHVKAFSKQGDEKARNLGNQKRT